METIESKQAIQLSENWGEQPCDHPTFGMEYNKTVPTGDYICLQCGGGFTKREMEEIENKRA